MCVYVCVPSGCGRWCSRLTCVYVPVCVCVRVCVCVPALRVRQMVLKTEYADTQLALLERGACVHVCMCVRARARVLLLLDD